MGESDWRRHGFSHQTLGLAYLLALVLTSAFISSVAHAYEVQSGPSFTPETDLRWEAYRRFTSHDGLPQNSIAALAQDRDGFIFAGTEEGVARYDGHRWQRVPYPEAVAAKRPFANRLAATPDGAVWVGTDIAGLLRHADGVMRPIALSGAAADQDIEALLVDKTDVWVGTPKGLFLCDANACREIAAARGLQVAVLLIAQGPQGEALYVGTNMDGLYRLDAPHGEAARAQWHLGRADGFPNNAVRALAQWGGADGRDLWIGTGRGLVRLSGERMIVYTKEQGMSPVGIGSLQASVDRDGTPVLWAGSASDGLAEFRDDGSWRRTTRENGLPDDAVGSLLLTDLDRKPPVLWIGATHAGVVRREPDSWAAFDERSGLPHRVVMSIGETHFPDRHDPKSPAIWLGSIDGSVRWNGKHWERWLPEKYRNRILNDIVSDGDVLWIGTDRGLLRMQHDEIREYSLDNSILPGASVIALFVEQDAGAGNTLWIGTHHGLAYIHDDVLAVERVHPATEEYFVRVVRTTPRADGSHLLWAGSDSGLLYKSAGAWHALPQGCLADSSVMDLRERGAPGRDHTLWVASRDGVILVDLDHDLACRRVEALPRSIVYQLQFDRSDRVYAFGVDGVARLRADASAAHGYAVEHFSLEDGLPGLEFNRASLVDHAGRIWGGSTEGVVLYDPAIETAAAAPRPLRLLGAHEEGSGRALSDGARFSAEQNNVAFDFSLLSYQRDHMTRYRAQLAGLDAPAEDWNDSTHRNYSRLPPGDYTFTVQARDGHGVESAPLSVRFRIDKPLWLTPWAIASYVIALIVFSLGVGRLRARTLQRRADRLEGEVKQRTRDLADANQQLERASLTDPLTGLWNRRYFAIEMQPESERAMRRVYSGEPHADVVLLLVDIDHFKRINDTLGHAGGDAVLVEFARRLADLVRASDIALRWGGEEFLIVLRDSERDVAAAFAERVRHAIAAEPFLVDAQRFAVSCSIGWAVYPFRREQPRAHSLEQVIALADQALYRAKQHGRNRVCGAVPGDGEQPRFLETGARADAAT